MNRLAAILLDEVVHTALQLAQILPNERRSPPMWMILDEAAHFAIPKLHKIMSYFSGSGIVLVPVFRDVSQISEVSGQDASQAIISNSLIKVILPGASSAQSLKGWEDLMGRHEVEHVSNSSGKSGDSKSVSRQRESSMEAAQIAGLPDGYATVFHRKSAFVMRLTSYTDQPWAKQVASDRADLAATVQAAKRPEIDRLRQAYNR